jgi:succinate dehydrogenase/fumarate reductase flavoprotein subunit
MRINWKMLEIFSKVFLILFISVLIGVSFAPDKTAEVKNANVIIIGGGLSGLTAAVTLADRGATVILIDKNPYVGGNSAYASSGINVAMNKEEIVEFFEDTYSSSEIEDSKPFIKILVNRSKDALKFLTERIGINLSEIG